MKVDVTGPILDIRGKTTQRPSGETDDKGQPIMVTMTFRDLIVDGLADRPNEQMKPGDKVRLFRLQLLVAGSDEVELTSDDVTLIKTRAGEGLTSLGYGRLLELLAEPDESRPVAAVPEPDAASNGHGDVAVDELVEVDAT